MTKVCELLAPAGNMDKLRAAVHYGADAVYLGGKEFSLRARAGNFTREGIVEAVEFAHKHGVKVYVTVNIFAHNRDLGPAAEYLEFLRGSGADALIISDPGILRLASRHAPDIPVHLSTQANTLNSSSVLFWQDMGVKRVNLARELGIAEIREIRDASDIELEVFVHGALCISYSGRCMLSLYLTGRDANQGNCAHPCRYKYRLEESKRPGEYFPVEEDGRGAYIFNSRDLCLAGRLPEIVAAGVDSIKIEGRMKGIYYVAGVVRAYRAALDFAQREKWSPEKPATIPSEILQELDTLGSRGYTENFFLASPKRDDMLYQGPEIDQTWIPAGIVLDDLGKGRARVKVASIIRKGDVLEYMHREILNTPFRVEEIIDGSGNIIEQAPGGSVVEIAVEQAAGFEPEPWSCNGLLRRSPPEHLEIKEVMKS